MAEALHIPVMLDEVCENLQITPDMLVVDGTFGAGGYTRALLEARCRVVAIDRDPNVKLLAEALAREFPGHFLFVEGCFSDMLQLLAAHNIDRVDGVVLDLGVSSMQLDEAARGFSFSKEAPLDMRMGVQALNAQQVVNGYDEASLIRILKEYGEERHAGKVARAIVAARAVAPIETTKALAEIVASALPRSREQIHPATRSFQAIRIEVNSELDELRQALNAAEALLSPGGRLVVVSFHSLEDRIVKQFLKTRSTVQDGYFRHDPRAFLGDASHIKQPSFHWPKPHKHYPKQQEIKNNPRARSAILRMAVRTSEPAWGAV